MVNLDEIFILVGFIQIALVAFMQWQIYISSVIKTFSIGSYFLAAFLLAAGYVNHEPYLMALGFLTAVIRGWFIPNFLSRMLRRDRWRARELKPVMGVASTIIVSLLFAVFGYVIYTWTMYDYVHSALGAIPVALFLQGAFLIISRGNPITQLIGYLVMENALYLFGSLFPELPFVVEAGVVLDVIGTIMISGVIVRLKQEPAENAEVDDSTRREDFTELRG
jgi:hydrogenase-4 component E